MCLKRKIEVNARRGAAIVELAVLLPVFVLIVLGTIEASSMIFLKQSLKIIAYEGARVAIVPGSDATNVQAGCNQMATSRGVTISSVVVTPNDFHLQPYGTNIQVQITADCNANSLISPWFYAGQSLAADVTMMKEY